MKKSLLLTLIGVALLLTGCEPSDWDLNSSGWEVFAEGTIKEKSIEQHPKSESRKVTKVVFENGDEVLIGHLKPGKNGRIREGETGILYKHNGMQSDYYSYFQWVPEGKQSETDPVVKVKNAINEVKKEFEGIKYLRQNEETSTAKHSRRLDPGESPDYSPESVNPKHSRLKPEFASKPYEPPIKEAKEPVNVSVWQDVYLKAPNINEPVLVKLKDGRLAIAHVDTQGDWKLNLNINKSSGGSSIDDVVEWKKVDLD